MGKLKTNSRAYTTEVELLTFIHITRVASSNCINNNRSNIRHVVSRLLHFIVLWSDLKLLKFNFKNRTVRFVVRNRTKLSNHCSIVNDVNVRQTVKTHSRQLIGRLQNIIKTLSSDLNVTMYTTIYRFRTRDRVCSHRSLAPTIIKHVGRFMCRTKDGKPPNT